MPKLCKAVIKARGGKKVIKARGGLDENELNVLSLLLLENDSFFFLFCHFIVYV